MGNKSGFIVAAAFIGPGTVTTASLAGATTGMHIAWALIFSVVATCVLQDMVIRLSASTGCSLSQNILSAFVNNATRRAIAALIFVAIGVGNAAYQSGNLTGAAIGLTGVASGTTEYWAVALGLAASLLIGVGSAKWVERILVALVALMSLVFVATLFIAQPDWGSVFRQLSQPAVDLAHLGLILALIGTTVVPYNLFLQSSLILKDKNRPLAQTQVMAIRKDSAVAITIGGIVSMTIMLTSAMTFYQTEFVLDITNLSQQLAPVLGSYAQTFFAVGLFSAGLTSAITAPLAASFAITSIMRWRADFSGKAFKTIAFSIIGLGVIFATIGIKPLLLIVIAQATNALLLPLIIAVLLYVMLRNTALGENKNSPVFTGLGMLVLLVVLGLSVYKVWGLLGG